MIYMNCIWSNCIDIFKLMIENKTSVDYMMDFDLAFRVVNMLWATNKSFGVQILN